MAEPVLSSSSSRSIQGQLEKRQFAELGAAGYMVRNTFIDIGGADEQPDQLLPQSPARRGTSAPPDFRRREASIPEQEDTTATPPPEEEDDKRSACSMEKIPDTTSTSPERVPEPEPEWSSGRSTANCKSPSRGRCQPRMEANCVMLPIPARHLESEKRPSPTPSLASGSDGSSSSPPPEERSAGSARSSSISGPHAEAVTRLRDVLLDELRFLRVHGSSYRDARLLEPQQADRRSCEGSLMLFIAGLPWAKRARWLVPLRWTVAMVLQKKGVMATVISGKLYVTDDSTRITLHIDFLPSLRNVASLSRSGAGAPTGVASEGVCKGDHERDAWMTRSCPLPSPR